VLGHVGGPGAAIAAELDRAHQRTATTALSGRELAVLQFLPTRLTNQEIGSQIFVSPNTVKTHLKSLYRRLGVGSRDEAVRRARQLGLLPPDRTARPAAGSRPGAGADAIGLEGDQRQAHLLDAGDHRVDVGDDALQGSGPR
jgi:DNA-binding CsgD family transcriptional regulator